MIVTPTADLVLDVLQAADPVTQRAAIAKLDALRPADADFEAALNSQVGEAVARAGAEHSSATAAQVETGSLGSVNAVAPASLVKAAPPGDVYRKFEAFVLQVFVETMLPAQAQDFFGKGTAGSVWRSMLAEQLGNQLAQGKGIGIARQLAAAHPVPRDSESGKAG